MEEHLGCDLVVSQRGGKQGGWTTITSLARDLIRRFEKQQNGVQDEMDEAFKQLFNDFF
jgi:molybdate transport repressor ModE-like protein